jgi:peptide subunit release factor 1 (eRF1)
MKLLNRGQVESLSGFRSKEHPTISLFLDTSRNRLSKKEIQISLKNMLQQGRSRLKQMDLSKSEKEYLFKELDNIRVFCSRHLPGYKHVGLAVFSCSSEGFWQNFDLVKSPRNMLIFDQAPYIRPLSAILDEYHRICILTSDKKTAVWYEVFMAEISRLETLTEEEEPKIRESVREEYSSKRIERHRNSIQRNHFKKVAKTTFDLWKQVKFEWLFLGIPDKYVPDLQSLLHPYIKKRIKARLKINPQSSMPEILSKTLDVKQKLKQEEKKETVRRFIEESRKNGLAVSGLGPTLERLNRGEVHTMLVSRFYSHPGTQCAECGFLYLNRESCPVCGKPTGKVMDIVDYAVENALNSSCRVKHISPPSDLDSYGNIGGFLRYKAG